MLPTVPALLTWLLWAGGGQVGPLPAPGETLWADGATGPRKVWRTRVVPRRAGWLLLEVDGRGPFADVDLQVERARADGAPGTRGSPRAT